MNEEADFFSFAKQHTAVVDARSAPLAERAIAALLAIGTEPEKLPELLGLSVREVETILRKESIIDLITDVQVKLDLNTAERLQRLAPLALYKKAKLMFSDKEAIVDKTTTYILDQSIGKALQKVETTSYNLNVSGADLDEQLQKNLERLDKLTNEYQKLVIDLDEELPMDPPKAIKPPKPTLAEKISLVTRNTPGIVIGKNGN